MKRSIFSWCFYKSLEPTWVRRTSVTRKMFGKLGLVHSSYCHDIYSHSVQFEERMICPLIFGWSQEQKERERARESSHLMLAMTQKGGKLNETSKRTANFVTLPCWLALNWNQCWHVTQYDNANQDFRLVSQCRALVHTQNMDLCPTFLCQIDVFLLWLFIFTQFRDSSHMVLMWLNLWDAICSLCYAFHLYHYKDFYLYFDMVPLCKLLNISYTLQASFITPLMFVMIQHPNLTICLVAHISVGTNCNWGMQMWCRIVGAWSVEPREIQRPLTTAIHIGDCIHSGAFLELMKSIKSKK